MYTDCVSLPLLFQAYPPTATKPTKSTTTVAATALLSTTIIIYINVIMNYLFFLIFFFALLPYLIARDGFFFAGFNTEH